MAVYWIHDHVVAKHSSAKRNSLSEPSQYVHVAAWVPRAASAMLGFVHGPETKWMNEWLRAMSHK